MKINKNIGKILFAVCTFLILVGSVLPLAAATGDDPYIKITAPETADANEEFEITVEARGTDGIMLIALKHDGYWDTVYNPAKTEEFEYTWTLVEEEAGNVHYSAKALDENENAVLDGVDVEILENEVPEITKVDATPLEGDAPLTVRFAAAAKGGDAPVAYKWDFGDGESATIGNPVHTYQEAGEYEARFIVTDADGDIDTESINIVVNGEADESEDEGETNEGMSIDLKINPDDEVKPGQEVEFEVEVENKLGYDVEDVVVTATIFDIDDGDELEEETEEFDLDGEDKSEEETKTLVLTIPYDADEDDYDVEIKVEWEADEDGYNVYEDTIEVEKDKHDVVVLSTYLSSETVAPGATADAAVEIANIGKNDENVRIKIQSTDLNIEEWSAEFELEEGDTAVQYIPFKVPENIAASKYFVNSVVYFDDGAEFNSDSVTITIEGATDEATGAVSLTPVVATTTSQDTGEDVSDDTFATGALIIGILVLLAAIAAIVKHGLPTRKTEIIKSKGRKRK
ncbi:PKD domain-containing protein [Candidatus Woesearchaeota archaeon]|nr:PKD domain-containing protein [Candidatus Woesearchaeota archaeon]